MSAYSISITGSNYPLRFARLRAAPPTQPECARDHGRGHHSRYLERGDPRVRLPASRADLARGFAVITARLRATARRLAAVANAVALGLGVPRLPQALMLRGRYSAETGEEASISGPTASGFGCDRNSGGSGNSGISFDFARQPSLHQYIRRIALSGHVIRGRHQPCYAFHAS